MISCDNCGLRLPHQEERYYNRYAESGEDCHFCYDCYNKLFCRNKIKPKDDNYSTGVATIEDWLGKKEGKLWILGKINEVRDRLNYLIETQRDFANQMGNPDWFRELGLELLLDRRKKEEKKLKNLVIKLDILEGRRHDYSPADLDAIKAIPIADLMPASPAQRATSRLYYKAPWRDEKQASLVVYVDKNNWHDYGEGIGGSNIDLFMKLNDCDFKVAVRELSKNL